MENLTANEVADFFLSFVHEHGDYLSQLKLHKLVFYSDAWFMVNNAGQPLIKDNFEAWIHGPVIRSLYNRFKDYRWQPILEPVDKPKLTQHQEAHLLETYQVFGKCSAYELEQMVHEEEPWIKARDGFAADEACENIIDKSLMYSFYTSVSKEKD
ncbi:MAG: DUF4065 domain-containing protein [Gammaproteobacteria bacterium]|nr:DUF4065 domain-containing protein [Gammaproteobacteria bacterium]